MFPARSLSVGLIVVLVLSLFVAFAVLLTPAHGYWGYEGCCGAKQTWCAWSETWHAYDALDYPLRPYYIPRMPGSCSRESYANNSGCGSAGCAIEGGNCGGGGFGYPPQAAVGLEPVRFERLGQIPNEMDLGGVPAPGQRSQ